MARNAAQVSGCFPSRRLLLNGTPGWIARACVRESPGVARELADGVAAVEIDRWSEARRESYAKGGASIASNERLSSDL